MSKIIVPKITKVKEPGTVFAAANVSESIIMNNNQVASFIIQSGQATKTAAVHTLTVVASFAAADTITINGTIYTCVATGETPGENEFLVGNATAVATALKALVEANETDFTVTRSTATLLFTQAVAGVGAILVIATSAVGAATIATTTAYNDGTKDLTVTVEGQVGSASGEAIMFLVGQVGSSAALSLESTKTVKVGDGQIYTITVTSDMLAGTGFDNIILKTTAIENSTIPGSIICLQSQPRYTE